MLNVTEAAHASGKSRTTLYRHIKAGKLSAEADPDGGYLIDPAELIRVYGKLVNEPERSPNATIGHDVAPDETPDNTVTITREEYDLLREAATKLPLVERHLNDIRALLPSFAESRSRNEGEMEEGEIISEEAAAPHEVKPDEEIQQEAGRIRKAWRVLRGK